MTVSKRLATLLGGICMATLLLASSCTMVLSESLGGTTAADSGILTPILNILEQELLDQYDSETEALLLPSRQTDSAGGGLEGTARSLSGGASSIKHGLPTTAITSMRNFIYQQVRAEGLEKSRDLNKVCPAVARATAAALVDESLSDALEGESLTDIHAIATHALTTAIHAPSVAALAEGLGSTAEKNAQIQAVSIAVADSCGRLRSGLQRFGQRRHLGACGKRSE